MSAIQLDGNGRPEFVPDGPGQADITGSGDVNLTLLEATMVRPMPASKPTLKYDVVAIQQRAPTAREMVRDIKARLRVVNTEIRARKTLERERDQLQRLLTALKTKPAPVRAIRSAG